MRGEQEPAGTVTASRIRQRRSWLRFLVIVAFVLFAVPVLAIIAFRAMNPPITPVMVAEKLRGSTVGPRRWVRLEDMSRYLPLTVIVSEDGRFCDHWGVDWRAIKDAVQEAEGFAGLRGASTLTMQTAKNLYLWPERSYLRKTLEVPLAYLMSALWPKTVVIETYLNIAPWGPGVVGAEAASRYYFKKGADALTLREASLLAAALPSPILRNPAKPSPKLERLAQSIEERMRSLASRAACVLQ